MWRREGVGGRDGRCGGSTHLVVKQVEGVTRVFCVHAGRELCVLGVEPVSCFVGVEKGKGREMGS